ncbi:MAG: AAA family ATPase [Candidatus Thorarchaeota archaeon]|nr:AAA family ATPase [Candidatus Thorarchaeota archaeon]
MKRVLVLGPSGAGKSTFAELLAKKLGIPFIHLDSYYWKPNWTATPSEEWPEIVQRLIKEEEWVMDGNYSTTLEMRLGRADTIVFIDVTRRVSYWRVLKRRIMHRGQARSELAEGCYEKIDWDFIKYIWTYPKLSKPRIMQIIERHSDRVQFVLLRSQQDICDFLEAPHS